MPSRLGGTIGFVALFMAVALILRLALLGYARHEVDWNLSLAAVFAWGALYDLGAALWWSLPVALVLAALPAQGLGRSWGRGLFWAALAGGLFLMFFAGVAEWTFWDEFGVRFNFIAVDYLVYTTEVIGNIRESYPMGLIFGGVGAATLAATWGLARTGWPQRWMAEATERWPRRWLGAACWVAVAVVLGTALDQRALPSFANNYNRELAKNGGWSLFAAFRDNQLDFDQFYRTLPVDEAFARVQAELMKDGSTMLGSNPHDTLRQITHPGEEKRLNVIQITVESLSANFMARYGNREGITPHLDALVEKSLVFDQFYATGTRTVRGMEALTLSLPPTPGRSLVKRPNNENLFTLGSVFRSRGYDTAFVYGGFGYFDNMNYFFSHNGYRVVDRTLVDDAEITFANAWGACDEDLFDWTLREADAASERGEPFFHFVMTTSNHRPFTYPQDRIDLPSKVSGRSGGVKYTDYAIDRFLRMAAKKPWFEDTLFVIVSDHCANSAGKTALPVPNYHIPLLIYAPGGQVHPGTVEELTSQVDYAPTLLGLLNWSYPSRFYGRDVLRPCEDDSPRAFIGTYQKIGLLERDRLAVLSPVRQSAVYGVEDGGERLVEQGIDGPLVDLAVSYYQTASQLYREGGFRAVEQ